MEDDVIADSSNTYAVIILLCVTVIAFLIASVLSRKSKIRFSLRTLLIATTLIALGLGLIMWLSSM